MTPATRIPLSVCLFITPDWCTSRHTRTGTDTHADALPRSCLAELSHCFRLEGFYLDHQTVIAFSSAGVFPLLSGYFKEMRRWNRTRGAERLEKLPSLLSPYRKRNIGNPSAVFCFYSDCLTFSFPSDVDLPAPPTVVWLSPVSQPVRALSGM